VRSDGRIRGGGGDNASMRDAGTGTNTDNGIAGACWR